jgi:hypothetical protein
MEQTGKDGIKGMAKSLAHRRINATAVLPLGGDSLKSLG